MRRQKHGLQVLVLQPVQPVLQRGLTARRAAGHVQSAAPAPAQSWLGQETKVRSAQLHNTCTAALALEVEAYHRSAMCTVKVIVNNDGD